MSKTIYVGRIPFDYTEEQVGDIFGSAGPIHDIRLMFDKETGKSKGFAFIEYFDAESAASAVRNLDNHQVGHLKLKVDYSDADGRSGGGGGGHHHQGHRGRHTNGEPQQAQGAVEHIAEVINNETGSQKDRFLGDLKEFASTGRDQLLVLLAQKPQLAYAIVQTMIDTGKIDQTIANTLLPGSEQPPAAPSSRSASNITNNRSQNNRRRVQTNSRSSTPQDRYLSPHPTPASRSKSPVRPSPSPAPATAPRTVTSNQEKAMIKQVLGLTPEQVDLLPPDQRSAVLEVRRKIDSGELIIGD